MSKSWLVFWNPKKLTGATVRKPARELTAERIDALIASGNEFTWDTGRNRHKVPTPGDRFFFVRTGSEPRGVVGYGEVVEYYEEVPYWNLKSKLTTTRDFGIRFTSHLTRTVLTFEQFQHLRLTHKTWSYQGSILELKDPRDAKKIVRAFDRLPALHEELEVLTFMEGQTKLMREHIRRERNRALVELKKEQALNRTGRLACEFCGFDFLAVYGTPGEGYIQAHHLLPIAELEKAKESTVKDLVLVCANCHAMLHRGLTVTTLRRLWADPKARAKRALARLLNLQNHAPRKVPVTSCRTSRQLALAGRTASDSIS